VPFEALAKKGGEFMNYVYLIETVGPDRQRYVGLTTNLKQRIEDHNAGKSPHTAKFKPWRLVTYVAFSDQPRAIAFERYLKSGSGHAFANKRLW
jgi:predicted GIY-YIG superfamily endonuclease